MKSAWDNGEKEETIKKNIVEEYKNFSDYLRNDSRPSMHKARMGLYSDMTELVEDTNLDVPFAYDTNRDVIKYNQKARNIESYDMKYSFAHEISHRMDELEYHSWENADFINALESCKEKVYNNRDEIQSWFVSGGKYENSFAISDIIGALTEGDISVGFGHEPEYWVESARYKPMEVFADISSIDVLRLNEKEDVLNELFSAY